jgi:membrane protease YdiL (CAAX protease family)
MTEPVERARAGVRHFAITCAVGVALAFLINVLFGERPLLAIALDGKPFIDQIAWGMAIALAVVVPIIAAILLLPILAPLRNQVVELFCTRVDFSGWNPLWMSMFAGCGEEVLFRGAIQPIIGLWLSSLVFVLLHSGTYQFRSLNWKKAVFAAFVFVVSLLLGYIFVNIGLLAAVVAHATLDVVALFATQRLLRQYAPCG